MKVNHNMHAYWMHVTWLSSSSLGVNNVMCYQKDFNTYQLIPEKMYFLSYMFDKAPNVCLKQSVVVKVNQSLTNHTSVWLSSHYRITLNISLTSCMGNFKILSVWWALDQTPHFWDSCRPQRVHKPAAQLCFMVALRSNTSSLPGSEQDQGLLFSLPWEVSQRCSSYMCTMFIRPSLVLTVHCTDKKDSQDSG